MQHEVCVVGYKLDPKESLLGEHAAVVGLRQCVHERRAVLSFCSSMKWVVLRTTVGDDSFCEAAIGGHALFSGQPSPGEGFGAVNRHPLEKECEERSKQGAGNGHETC